MSTHYFLAATLSWIDPVTRLPEVDVRGRPPASITRSDVVGRSIYRFANLLELSLQVEAGRVLDGEITKDSGLYLSSSFLETKAAQVGRIGQKKERRSDGLVFRQLVGCRTEAAEKIGQAFGSSVGRLIGGVNSKAEIAGGFIGREIAEFAKSFPPIWSEIEVVVGPWAGAPTARVTRHSLFPSLSAYTSGLVPSASDTVALTRNGTCYNGVPNLKRWEGGGGWGPSGRTATGGPRGGNPWTMVSPADLAPWGPRHHKVPDGY